MEETNVIAATTVGGLMAKGVGITGGMTACAVPTFWFRPSVSTTIKDHSIDSTPRGHGSPHCNSDPMSVPSISVDS
jgi:hypothetical protein